MNSVVLSGRICTVPKIKLLQIEGKSVSMCVFTIAVAEMCCEFDNADPVKIDMIILNVWHLKMRQDLSILIL